MTEIKTAQAWGWLGADGNLRDCWVAATHPDGEPVHFRGVIVYGLTEAEVHEAAALRDACRELGIETVEQLRAKVQPDPRAAVLEAAIQQHKRNVSIGVKNANQCLWYVIAAQRVEVEG